MRHSYLFVFMGFLTMEETMQVTIAETGVFKNLDFIGTRI